MSFDVSQQKIYLKDPKITKMEHAPIPSDIGRIAADAGLKVHAALVFVVKSSAAQLGSK